MYLSARARCRTIRFGEAFVSKGGTITQKNLSTDLALRNKSRSGNNLFQETTKGVFICINTHNVYGTLQEVIHIKGMEEVLVGGDRVE